MASLHIIFVSRCEFDEELPRKNLRTFELFGPGLNTDILLFVLQQLYKVCASCGQEGRIHVSLVK